MPFFFVAICQQQYLNYELWCPRGLFMYLRYEDSLLDLQRRSMFLINPRQILVLRHSETIGKHLFRLTYIDCCREFLAASSASRPFARRPPRRNTTLGTFFSDALFRTTVIQFRDILNTYELPTKLVGGESSLPPARQNANSLTIRL